MKKSASCKSPIREANISDREGTGMGQNVYRWSMCEKDKNIRNEANRKKISKYVFLKIHGKRGNIREKGGKNRCKMRLNMC